MDSSKFFYTVLLGVLLSMCSSSVFAQDETPTPKQIRKSRPKYFQTAMGFNRASVRDFATSPITYKGALFNLSMGFLKMDDAREVKFTARYNMGNVGYKRKEGIDVKSSASVFMLSLNYYRLYQLNSISNDKWNFKLGGMFDANFDTRINGDLLNAAFGYEMFNTFFLSGKVTRVFERTETVQKKLLFIKYKLHPRVQLISYQLNVPVMNNVLRNGYAYIANESIGEIPLFQEYEYKVFSGLRFSSELSYTNQMHNGNMWRVSYIWDAYKAGKSFNRFEMANHIVEMSLLFHLNKNKYR
ncbi:MAG: hypothetical protein H6551_05285 [Chitinophagales bacterium]|nr:hypothetical protein [Chitinophagaceae bacterium]MCB9064542.1 hypothetical protein [Chitinophagales bacterium]